MTTCEIHTCDFTNVPWLLGELHPKITDVLHLGTEFFWRQHSVVFHPGKPFTSVHILTEGSMAISAVKKDGSRYPLWIMCPGNIIGENALLSRRPSQRYIETLEDCRTIAFTPETMFETIIPRYPEIGLALMENMAIKAFITSRRNMEVNLPLTIRIAMFVYICTFEHNNIPAPIRELSVEKIADMFHTPKNTASMIINKLIHTGMLEIKDGAISVKDRAKLAQISFMD